MIRPQAQRFLSLVRLPSTKFHFFPQVGDYQSITTEESVKMDQTGPDTGQKIVINDNKKSKWI